MISDQDRLIRSIHFQPARSSFMSRVVVGGYTVSEIISGVSAAIIIGLIWWGFHVEKQVTLLTAGIIEENRVTRLESKHDELEKRIAGLEAGRGIVMSAESRGRFDELDKRLDAHNAQLAEIRKDLVEVHREHAEIISRLSPKK